MARRRLDIFIGFCRLKRYSYFTVKAYFAELRRTGIFDDEDDDDDNDIETHRTVTASMLNINNDNYKIDQKINRKKYSQSHVMPDKRIFNEYGKRHIRAVKTDNCISRLFLEITLVVPLPPCRCRHNFTE